MGRSNVATKLRKHLDCEELWKLLCKCRENLLKARKVNGSIEVFEGSWEEKPWEAPPILPKIASKRMKLLSSIFWVKYPFLLVSPSKSMLILFFSSGIFERVVLNLTLLQDHVGVDASNFLYGWKRSHDTTVGALTVRIISFLGSPKNWFLVLTLFGKPTFNCFNPLQSLQMIRKKRYSHHLWKVFGSYFVIFFYWISVITRGIIALCWKLIRWRNHEVWSQRRDF